jgi:homoserine O-succinyltransferase/O-acetyltransferase
MPIFFQAVRSGHGSAIEGSFVGSPRYGNETASRSEHLEIGLINNMPDAALQATERQFVELLNGAAHDLTVRMHFFSLPQIPRGEAAAAHLRHAYSDATELDAARLDALIVTGNEPRAPRLDQEPYWASLTKIIDWAEHNTVSTIWSCLAAHAAVLHLDGVDRHRLQQKRFGLFQCNPVLDDPLLSGVRSPLRVSHSRWNELQETELVSHGYRILTRSPEAGVDIFAKQWRSLFVFFQGHPEYDADSLAREYRRDMGRFLRGESEACPHIPGEYFDARSERALRQFEIRAQTSRQPDILTSFPDDLVIRPELARSWRAAATPLLSNWLRYLASRKV